MSANSVDDQKLEIIKVMQKLGSELTNRLTQLTDKQRITFVGFEINDRSISELEQIRGVKSSTIVSDLIAAIKIGLPVNLKKLNLTLRDYKQIIAANQKVGQVERRLTAIKDNCDPTITFEKINLALAVHQYECNGGNLCKYFPAEDKTRSVHSSGKKEEVDPPKKPRLEAECSNEAQKLKDPSTSATASKVNPAKPRTNFIEIDSDSDDELFAAAEILEKSYEEETTAQKSQDPPTSMGTKKIRKLFTKPRVQI
ncbi:uncharacterized protein LOC132194616 [Neocloeon triangulifer]|uniref:uncharacterized protein LOC132194616 n=1 Tax=Neocloeon triangulifer TaxID=2078957 RepID=UPI00286F5086|nr:uncharacterized protein LOC132194616 [Neocloeon triangulifer]